MLRFVAVPTLLYVVKVMGRSVPESGELVLLKKITSISVPEIDELFCT
jgi:hypothetical protein